MTTTLWRTGLFLAMIGTGLTTAGAADLFWQGGGNWSDAAWATASGGPYSQPWTGGSNAVFETTAGAISVDTATSVGDMAYSVSQTIAGNQSLTLSGTTATVHSAVSATISASLGGDTLTKAGAGALILSGSNSHTGLTTVSAGVLDVRSGAALGTTAGGTTVADGASLHLQGGITVTGESLNLIGQGINYVTAPGALLNISGDNRWTGDITIGSAITRIVSNAGALTLDGDIALTGSAANHLVLQGNGNILINGDITGGGSSTTTLTRSGVGSGIMTLAGTNTYLGATLISGGTLQVGNGGDTGTLGAGNVTNNASLVVNRTGAITLAQVISGTGSLTQKGAGTLTLSGANSYSGLTTVSAGVLKITHNTALGTNTTGTDVVSGAALHLQGGITVSGESLTLAGTGFNYGGALRNLSGDNTWAGPIATSGGQVNITSSTGLLTFSGPVTLSASESTYNLVLIPTTNGPILVSGDITGGADGSSVDRRSVTLGSASSGVATLSGTNTYLGRTTLNGGTLRAEGGSAIPDASMLVLGANTVFQLGDDETIGSFTGDSTTAVQLNDNTLTTGADNYGSLQIFSGVLSGTGGLTKTGTGGQALTGANTYTGDTTVEQGFLHISSSGSIHADSAIKIAETGLYRVVVLADGTGNSAGSRRSQLTSSSGNAIELPAAITAVASTATSLVDMQWRPRTTAEEALHLSSDVLTLSNTLPTVADAFVLQMAYDSTLPWIAGQETQLVDAGLLFLVSDTSGSWRNAVFNNSLGSPLWMGDMTAPADDLTSKLGWYGVDTSGTTPVAWAVLDYGGSFSVAIPEPGTFALLAAGLLALIAPRRRRR